MEVCGKIEAKYKDNRAVKLDDGKWYNLMDSIKSFAEQFKKDDEVVLIYEKKGTTLTVSSIMALPLQSAPAKPEPVKEEPKSVSSTGFACTVCGKELKDGKFKVCYTCNKKNPKPAMPKTGEYKSNYGSPEDVAGKEIGCALGAAATVGGGQNFGDPETAKQFTLILAEEFLGWIRAKK